MKKRYIISLGILGGVILFLLIFLICFFNIPRITYGYDSETETYYVDHVYGNAKTYTIANEVNHRPVTKIRSRAFMDKTELEEVRFGSSLIVIERLAFLNCKKLKTIDLSGVEIIGRNAFENCLSLESVHLTVEDIMGGTFMGCSKLQNIVLENTLSIGSYAFAETSVIELTIPRTCASIGNDAFYECLELNKIVVLSYELRNNAYLKSLGIVDFQIN